VVSRSQVGAEQGHWVAGERVGSQDDDVPFKKLVGLVARQEKLKSVISDDNRVAFDEFARVSEVFNLWPGEFTQTHESEKTHA
jgi:hypothetical protein